MKQQLNPDRCDIHYMYRHIQHYGIQRVNKWNYAMRVAEGVCKEKTEAFREWVKAIREAFKREVV